MYLQKIITSILICTALVPISLSISHASSNSADFVVDYSIQVDQSAHLESNSFILNTDSPHIEHISASTSYQITPSFYVPDEEKTPTPPDSGGGHSFYCGDGLVANNEQCDDGNPFSGDGCSSQCKIEENTPPITQPKLTSNTETNTPELLDTSFHSSAPDAKIPPPEKPQLNTIITASTPTSTQSNSCILIIQTPENFHLDQTISDALHKSPKPTRNLNQCELELSSVRFQLDLLWIIIILLLFLHLTRRKLTRLCKKIKNKYKK